MLELLEDHSAVVALVALTGIFAYSFHAVLIAGQLSLAQAGLASLAAFTSSLVVPDQPLLGVVPRLVVGMIAGMLAGAAVAVVLALPLTRLRGVFLAIATLGFGEVVRVVLINMSWTGGAQGLSFPKLVGVPQAWCALAVVAYGFWRLGPSRLGRALAAIREDETAAAAMGIDVARHRLGLFTASGAIAGLYGVLLAHFSRFAEPNEFGFAAAVDGLVVAVVGGTALFIGPLLGSGFLTLIPEVQRGLGIEAGWVRPFLAGALMLTVIIFLPGGLAALIPRRRLRSTPGTTQFRPPPRPPPGQPILRLTAVGKDYGGVRALHGVDLDVQPGEILGLIGPNGAGKTTLVNIITGAATPTAGEGTVLGLEIGPHSTPHLIALAGVGRTFQQSRLFDRLSAIDNVILGAYRLSRPTYLRRLLFLPSARRDERAAGAHAASQLDRVGLADRSHVLAANLSLAERRRLEVARALAGHPALLVLDEPAAGMDEGEAATLAELIRSLVTEATTVLLIEHNVGMVLEISSRIVVLDSGEVLAAGDPAIVARDPRVIATYLGTAEPEQVTTYE